MLNEHGLVCIVCNMCFVVLSDIVRFVHGRYVVSDMSGICVLSGVFVCYICDCVLVVCMCCCDDCLCVV